MPFAALHLALALQITGAPAVEPVAAHREVLVMGTILRGSVEATSHDQAQAALERAVAEIEGWERLLSTWDPATPMSVANRAPIGIKVPLPSTLAALLDEALTWSSGTGGAFDPVLGALVDAWDLRGGGRTPDEVELREALARSGTGTFGIDGRTGTLTRLSPGAWIDTGAFGKGAALRAAGSALRPFEVTRGTLDLGGQILVVGTDPEPGEVVVAHPRHRTHPVARLLLQPGWSAATSGNSERGIDVDGKRLGHILDPRTGRPAPDWGSVTVVAADPLVADILSTALYVMGPDAGLAWAEARDDVGALFLVADGDGTVQTLSNRAMNRWLAQPPAGAGSSTTHAPERRIP